MVFDIGNRRSRIFMALLLGLGVLGALQLFSPPAEASRDLDRLTALEAQAGELGLQLEALSGGLNAFSPVPPKTIGQEPTIQVAQSARNLASLNVRLGQLEEQIRVLTGQVEGLQFQMTQMQTFLERQQEDYEFRFLQLEGGVSGKTDAAPQSDDAMSFGGAPQNQNLQQPDLTAPGGETITDLEGGVFGVPGQPLGALPQDHVNLSGQALDLSFGSGELVTTADADAQYRAGYEAVVRGDFSFAEEQFRQFVSLFPTHPQAPDATNWLGEALILRGEYQEAADVLLTGFQSYSASARAPDLLLKLGQALAGAGEYATACRTFAEVPRRYPDISENIKTRLNEEQLKAKC